MSSAYCQFQSKPQNLKASNTNFEYYSEPEFVKPRVPARFRTRNRSYDYDRDASFCPWNSYLQNRNYSNWYSGDYNDQNQNIYNEYADNVPTMRQEYQSNEVFSNRFPARGARGARRGSRGTRGIYNGKNNHRPPSHKYYNAYHERCPDRSFDNEDFQTDSFEDNLLDDDEVDQDRFVERLQKKYLSNSEGTRPKKRRKDQLKSDKTQQNLRTNDTCNDKIDVSENEIFEDVMKHKEALHRTKDHGLGTLSVSDISSLNEPIKDITIKNVDTSLKDCPKKIDVNKANEKSDTAESSESNKEINQIDDVLDNQDDIVKVTSIEINTEKSYLVSEKDEKQRNQEKNVTPNENESNINHSKIKVFNLHEERVDSTNNKNNQSIRGSSLETRVEEIANKSINDFSEILIQNGKLRSPIDHKIELLNKVTESVVTDRICDVLKKDNTAVKKDNVENKSYEIHIPELECNKNELLLYYTKSSSNAANKIKVNLMKKPKDASTPNKNNEANKISEETLQEKKSYLNETLTNASSPVQTPQQSPTDFVSHRPWRMPAKIIEESPQELVQRRPSFNEPSTNPTRSKQSPSNINKYAHSEANNVSGEYPQEAMPKRSLLNETSTNAVRSVQLPKQSPSNVNRYAHSEANNVSGEYPQEAVQKRSPLSETLNASKSVHLPKQSPNGINRHVNVLRHNTSPRSYSEANNVSGEYVQETVQRRSPLNETSTNGSKHQQNVSRSVHLPKQSTSDINQNTNAPTRNNINPRSCEAHRVSEKGLLINKKDIAPVAVHRRTSLNETSRQCPNDINNIFKEPVKNNHLNVLKQPRRSSADDISNKKADVTNVNMKLKSNIHHLNQKYSTDVNFNVKSNGFHNNKVTIISNQKVNILEINNMPNNNTVKNVSKVNNERLFNDSVNKTNTLKHNENKGIILSFNEYSKRTQMKKKEIEKDQRQQDMNSLKFYKIPKVSSPVHATEKKEMPNLKNNKISTKDKIKNILKKFNNSPEKKSIINNDQNMCGMPVQKTNKVTINKIDEQYRQTNKNLKAELAKDIMKKIPLTSSIYKKCTKKKVPQKKMCSTKTHKNCEDKFKKTFGLKECSIIIPNIEQMKVTSFTNNTKPECNGKSKSSNRERKHQGHLNHDEKSDRKKSKHLSKHDETNNSLNSDLKLNKSVENDQNPRKRRHSTNKLKVDDKYSKKKCCESVIADKKKDTKIIKKIHEKETDINNKRVSENNIFASDNIDKDQSRKHKHKNQLVKVDSITTQETKTKIKNIENNSTKPADYIHNKKLDMPSLDTVENAGIQKSVESNCVENLINNIDELLNDSSNILTSTEQDNEINNEKIIYVNKIHNTTIETQTEDNLVIDNSNDSIYNALSLLHANDSSKTNTPKKDIVDHCVKESTELINDCDNSITTKEKSTSMATQTDPEIIDLTLEDIIKVENVNEQTENLEVDEQENSTPNKDSPKLPVIRVRDPSYMLIEQEVKVIEEIVPHLFLAFKDYERCNIRISESKNVGEDFHKKEQESAVNELHTNIKMRSVPIYNIFNRNVDLFNRHIAFEEITRNLINMSTNSHYTVEEVRCYFQRIIDFSRRNINENAQVPSIINNDLRNQTGTGANFQNPEQSIYELTNFHQSNLNKHYSVNTSSGPPPAYIPPLDVPQNSINVQPQPHYQMQNNFSVEDTCVLKNISASTAVNIQSVQNNIQQGSILMQRLHHTSHTYQNAVQSNANVVPVQQLNSTTPQNLNVAPDVLNNSFIYNQNSIYDRVTPHIDYSLETSSNSTLPTMQMCNTMPNIQQHYNIQNAYPANSVYNNVPSMNRPSDSRQYNVRSISQAYNYNAGQQVPLNPNSVPTNNYQNSNMQHNQPVNIQTHQSVVQHTNVNNPNRHISHMTHMVQQQAVTPHNFINPKNTVTQNVRSVQQKNRRQSNSNITIVGGKKSNQQQQARLESINKNTGTNQEPIAGLLTNKNPQISVSMDAQNNIAQRQESVIRNNYTKTATSNQENNVTYYGMPQGTVGFPILKMERSAHTSTNNCNARGVTESTSLYPADIASDGRQHTSNNMMDYYKT